MHEAYARSRYINLFENEKKKRKKVKKIDTKIFLDMIK